MNELNKFLIKKKEFFGKEKGADLSFESEHSMDLFASLHSSDILVNGQKNEDGTWNLDFKLTDIYDFTDFVNPFIVEVIEKNEKGENVTSKKIAGLGHMGGWIANDLAYLSQKDGAITPYKVTIYFSIAGYVAE